MVIIYTQDQTYIRKDAEAAREALALAYGAKLGEEAYKAINKAPVGASYRANGGPLVQVVTKEKAEWIRRKEMAIGMMEM